MHFTDRSQHRQLPVADLLDQLKPRTDSEQSSVAQGNTPDVNRPHELTQQVDIQRKDQKPHIAPAPDPDHKTEPADAPGDTHVPESGPLGDDNAQHPDHYISRTPYHR